MTVYAITDTKKGRTGIAPTYLQTTLHMPMNALDVLCAQLTRDLFAIAKFLLMLHAKK